MSRQYANFHDIHRIYRTIENCCFEAVFKEEQRRPFGRLSFSPGDKSIVLSINSYAKPYYVSGGRFVNPQADANKVVSRLLAYLKEGKVVIDAGNEVWENGFVRVDMRMPSMPETTERMQALLERIEGDNMRSVFEEAAQKVLGRMTEILGPQSGRAVYDRQAKAVFGSILHAQEPAAPGSKRLPAYNPPATVSVQDLKERFRWLEIFCFESRFGRKPNMYFSSFEKAANRKGLIVTVDSRREMEPLHEYSIGRDQYAHDVVSNLLTRLREVKVGDYLYDDSVKDPAISVRIFLSKEPETLAGLQTAIENAEGVYVFDALKKTSRGVLAHADKFLSPDRRDAVFEEQVNKVFAAGLDW